MNNYTVTIRRSTSADQIAAITVCAGDEESAEDLALSLARRDEGVKWEWEQCQGFDQDFEIDSVELDKPLDLPPLGTRLRLRRDVERYPNFTAPAGLTGTVVHSSEHLFGMFMDVPMKEAGEWNNCLEWMLPEDAESILEDFEVIR